MSYKSKKVKLIPREDWKIAINTHEAIIEKALFDRVQVKINLRKKAKHNNKFEWLFNGLVYCKECGNKMTLKIKRDNFGDIRSKIIVCSCSLKKGKNRECERKSKSIKEEVLRNIIISSITKKVNNIINNDKLEEITQKEFEKKTTYLLDNQIKMLSQKLSKTDTAISSLYEDYSNNIIEEEDYRRFYQSEVERRNTLKSEINKLIKQREEKRAISKEELLEIISKLKNIEDWTSEKLSELLYNIEINKDNQIFINYRYDVIGKL